MTDKEARPYRPDRRVIGTFGALAAAGAISLAAAAFFTPARAWANLLLASYYILGLGLAGLLFVAFHYVTGAAWSTAFRRVPEAMAVGVPVAALGVAALLAFKSPLYPWFGEVVAEGEAMWFKAAWLDPLAFRARAALYFVIWIFFAWLIRRQSRRQDADGKFSRRRWNARLSALFLVFFAVTFWLASYDWIMALDPAWYSTIFGAYNFAGLFQSGLAAIIVLAVALRRAGALRNVLRDEHLHDLGKLLFGFSCFWMYLWFSQYMLIWYAHLPEETTYFVARAKGYWAPLFLLQVVLNWAVPFFFLLPRRAKRSASVLATVAGVVLVGRWLDLYINVMPPFAGETPAFGFAEVGSAVGVVGLFSLVFLLSFRRASPVPRGDATLSESLNYRA